MGRGLAQCETLEVCKGYLRLWVWPLEDTCALRSTLLQLNSALLHFFVNFMVSH